VLLLIGLLAQVLGIEADATQWGELGVATLFVWGSVELLRKKVDYFKALDGVQVHVFAGAVGIVLGIAFGIAGIVTGQVVDWVLFGIQATLYATFADLFAKKVGGQGNQRLAA